jgi:ribosomal-protein-alanine N-acetyltransferase
MAAEELQTVIRLLGAGELDMLVPLHAACFEDAWDLEALATLLAMPGALALVAVSGHGDLSGFVMIRGAADEAEIVSLGVHPAARRRGLGRRLMAKAIAAALDRGVRRMFLEVAADNSAAQRLYLREGFAKVGERPNYYHKTGGDVAALVMARDIAIGSSVQD